MVKPIVEDSLLDRSKRKHVEFLYLVLTRLRNTLEVLDRKCGQHPNDLNVVSVRGKVKELLAKVKPRWLSTSEDLTSLEGQVKHVFWDGIQRLLPAKVQPPKEIFLAGIENIDYSQVQQVDFTVGEYERSIQQCLTRHDSAPAKQVKINLRIYRSVMQMSRAQAPHANFQLFIDHEIAATSRYGFNE